jgi:hypothetical protein
MATPYKTKITDETRIIDITIGDLKALIRKIVEEVVNEAMFELEQQLPDPDEGLEFKPEIAEYLSKPCEARGPYISMEELTEELGLDDE